MPDSPNIYVLLNEVKKEVGAVRKKETNQQQHFNFRGIDAVVNACAPVLNKYGVITIPRVVEQEYETVEIGQRQTKMGHVTVVVDYDFFGPEGDHVTARVTAESMDAGDKACAKAMSVAYRIALLQTLNLPTDEPDPDSQTYERSGGNSTTTTTRTKAPTKAQSDEAVDKLDSETKVLIAIDTSKTIADLRIAWKAAGKLGILQNTVANVTTGEKSTIQEKLIARNDALSFRESAGDADPSGEN